MEQAGAVIEIGIPFLIQLLKDQPFKEANVHALKNKVTTVMF